MRLESESGSSVDLSIVRYEFAGGDNEFDLNWLVVRGDVHTEARSWAFEDPCLLVSEARGLGSWLRHVTNPAAEFERLGFTEPNLWFDIAGRNGDSVTVRIGFDLESAPPDVPRLPGDDACWVDLDLSVRDLVEASDAWFAGLDAFPERRP